MASKLFTIIRQAKSIVEEVDALERLEDHLLSLSPTSFEQEEFEDDYLHNVSMGDVHRPETSFPEQDILDEFVCYVLVRRFGWSEGGGALAFTDPQNKLRINESLSNILHWFHEEVPSERMITSLIYALKHAQQKPVVRSQTTVHLMEWLKQGDNVLESNIFDTVQTAILLSLSDVWSPIRSACVSRLGYVIEKFNMHQLEIFFTELIAICKKSSSSWQAREGAIMGINTIIRKFQWIGILPDGFMTATTNKESNDTSKCEFILKFGSSEFAAMPEFISGPLNDVVYTLLSDPQLSIREQTIKGYSAYLGRCELNVAVQTFDQMVAKLNPSKADMKIESLFLKNFTFLGDYEAEGLLGVCVHLVKQIPSQHLLPMWRTYFPVFSMYLGHTACTVRQVTSTIFKFVVAKDSSNPAVLKLVLHNLSLSWLPNMALLNHDYSNSHLGAAPTGGSHGHLTLKKWLAGKRDVDALFHTWEHREGRLLAYELILQFLIKNHWLYTFGSANLVPPSSPRRPEHLNPIDKDSHAFDRASSPIINRVLHHSMKGEHGVKKYDPGRRGSCSPPCEDIYMLRPRTSSESLSNRVVSEYVDVPSNQQQHSCLCPHHRIGSITQASNSLGSTQDGKSGRMPTVYGCGVTSVKPFGRHYSYYSKGQISDNSESSPHATSASSLLSLCLDSEHQLTKEVDDHQVSALSDILRQVLTQCVESMADDRWELRRMGQQLLPCVAEVIRWYNITLMEEFLDTNLKPTTSLLTYGGCVCLKHSLSHAARLQWLLQEPPTSWQDVRLCQRMIQSIIRCIKRRLPDWLNVIHGLLKRPIIDKLSVVSLETIMIAIGNFSIGQFEKAEMSKSVIHTMIKIYAHCHEDDTISTLLNSDTSSQELRIMTEGFLSCRADAAVRSTSLQIEKYFLTEIHPLLRHFIENAPVDVTAILLPLVTSWLGHYIEDDILARHLIESISSLCSQIDLYLENNKQVLENQDIRDCCTRALQHLTRIALQKSLDQQSVRQVLELGLTFLKVMPPHDVVQELLLTAATRMAQISDSKPGSASSRQQSVDDQDLYLQSNDVLVLSSTHTEGPPSDEDDHLGMPEDGPMPETQILNLSGNSSHSVSSRRRSRCNSEETEEDKSDSENDSSDWDDWDDEDKKEDHSGMEALLSEFLTNLKSRLKKLKQNSVLEHSLQKFQSREREILLKLLS